MAYKVPTSYVAAAAVTIGGTTYAKGATITTAAVKAMKHADALASAGLIKPSPDPHRRRGRWRPWPTTVHAAFTSVGIHD